MYADEKHIISSAYAWLLVCMWLHSQPAVSWDPKGAGPWPGYLKSAYPEFLKTEVLCLPKRESRSKANSRGLAVRLSAATTFWLRLSHSLWPLTLWRCCPSPWQQLVQQAWKRPETLSPGAGSHHQSQGQGSVTQESLKHKEAWVKELHLGWKSNSLLPIGLNPLVSLTTVSVFS